MPWTKFAPNEFYDWHPWAAEAPECCGGKMYLWHPDDPRWFCSKCMRLREQSCGD